MKNKRHKMILELIQNNDIDTQEDLLKLLKENQYHITQATVSRDIKELKLIKVPTENGKYKYKYNKPTIPQDSPNFLSIFSSSIAKIDIAQNMVVIKTISGMAQAICANIDSLHFDHLVGTIAGDDTIFIAMQDNKSAKNIVDIFQDLIFGR